MSMSFRTIRNLGLGILLSIVVLLSVFSYTIISKNSNVITAILTVEQGKREMLYNLSISVHNLREFIQEYSAGENRFVALIMPLTDKTLSKLGEIQKLTFEKTELTNLENTARAIIGYRQSAFDYIREVKKNGRETAPAVRLRDIALWEANNIVRLTKITVDYIDKVVYKKNENTLNVMGSSFNALIIVLIAAVVITLIVAFLVDRAIAKPIHKLVKATRRISKGDLSSRIDIRSSDEIGQLADAFNKMTEDLERTTTSVVNLNREVNERKKAEEELKSAYDKLRRIQDMLIQAEKMNAVGRLAAGVAHEVKNPLAAMLMSVDYFAARAKPSDKEASLMLDNMRGAIERADRVIRGLLDFARPSQIEKAQQDLNSIIEKSLLLVKYQLDKAHIKTTKNLQKNLPHVYIDKNGMEQVFINLLSNAVNAMPDGGELAIKTYVKESIKYDATEDIKGKSAFIAGEDVIVVEVEDTGMGISESNLNNLFDPFFTTRREKGGTGLGLSIIMGIVDAHGGRIKLENKKNGKGARAIVTLKIEKIGRK